MYPQIRTGGSRLWKGIVMGTWWKKLISKKDECVCHAQTKSLCEAGEGGRFRVECLCGEDRICERLREMGFCESSVIEKVADSGALICKVCDAKVVLSKELAKKILVKDVCSCSDHHEHK